MSNEIEMSLYVLILAVPLGLQLVQRVSPLLHTPLMSLTNAISAISVVGAILVAGQRRRADAQQGAGMDCRDVRPPSTSSAGFLITDRMLKMFKKKETKSKWNEFWQIAYIIAALSVVVSIKWLSSPVTARRGVLAGQFGMLLAVVGTLLRHEVVDYEWILISDFHRSRDRRASRVFDADDRRCRN